jgi:hypothetical protein
MTFPNKKIHGNSIPGCVSIISTDSSMMLVMTEETATADYPAHELVNMLALKCGIQDQSHITLLLMVLGKSSPKSIQAAFLQQGIKVEGLSHGMCAQILGTSLDTSCKRPNTSL